MTYKVLKVLSILTLLLSACGGKESYTEKEYLEDAFLATCTKYQKCDNTAFSNKFSSIGDCVENYKKEKDSNSGDDAITYRPVCGSDYMFDPDAAKRAAACLSAGDCQFWDLEDVYSSTCAYLEEVCLERCSNKGEKKCANNVVRECNGQTWEEKEDCDLTDKECLQSAGAAECLPPSCTGDEMKCVGRLLLECKDTVFEQTDCGETCNTCATGKGCVPRDDACLTDGQMKCEGTKVFQCVECDWADIWDCATQGQRCVLVGENVVACENGPL